MTSPSSIATIIYCLTAFVGGCAFIDVQTHPLSANIQSEGLINCIAPNTKDRNGVTTYCEASAVAAQNNQLLIASDKPLVGQQSLLRVTRQGLKPLPGSESIVNSPASDSARKIEAMTITPDGKTLFVTTAFDRIDRQSAALDSYNMLLAGPAANLGSLKVIAASTRQNITSSLLVRFAIEAHIGVPYFKIEGLVALPNQRLIFGIRETGSSHKQFDYRFLLLECRYEINDEYEIILQPAFKTLLDFDTTQVLPEAQGLGLSSIEYEPTKRRLYFATSHETDASMGAYFWHMTLSQLDAGQRPELIRQPNGQPLHTNNKAEGIAKLDEAHLFVINDDDRNTGGALNRQPHQAVYQIIRILE